MGVLVADIVGKARQSRTGAGSERWPKLGGLFTENADSTVRARDGATVVTVIRHSHLHDSSPLVDSSDGV